MRRVMRILIMTSIAVTVASPAFAQPPQTIAVGAGSQSCGGWLSVQDDRRKTNVVTVKESMMLSWVQGYLVGAAQALTLRLGPSKPLALPDAQATYGTLSGWIYDMPDPEAITHWVTKYCREHPLEPLVDAAGGLAGELFTKRK